MRHIRSFVASLFLLGIAVPGLAQSLTGSIVGTITDQQGAAIPGVTVTLTGKTGAKTTVSDASGEYRFLALDPGSYSVLAEIPGFIPKKQENLTVSIAKQVAANLVLAVAGVTETLEVVGEAPVVDVTSSSTDNALSQDLLFNLPIRPTNAATDLLNFLPGVHGGSAYGGDSDTANALLLDGVDTRDPEGGSAWTFFNFNIVDEVQLQGLGAPAEYGAFTGAVVNTITKSGGNEFSGLFDAYYSKGDLASDNVTAEIVDQNPSLAIAATTKKYLDLTAQLSGPVIKDKLFFFASAQRFKFTEDPAGPRTIRDEVSPRFNVKLTYQPSANDTLIGMFQADDYNVIGRPPSGLDLLVPDEVTNREDAPEYVWNFQWRHLFGSNAFAELKYTGYWGYFDLNPEVEKPGHYDTGSALYSVSQGWFYYADRGRHQVNASISRYAEAFGKHDFKFGVEVERSKVRSRYGYVNDILYYDYAAYYPVGQYTAYDYGYDVQGRNQRESLYAQDSWKVNDRLTLNPGVRFDWVRGRSPALDKKVYDTKNIAPRFGFALDLTGDGNTVLKGSYSQYYEGAFFLTYSAAVPGIEDYVYYSFDPSGDKCGPEGNCFSEYDRSPSPLYRVDPEIKHPRVDEITAGIERAITKDLRFSVTGIYREDKNLQASVSPSARWTPIQAVNELTGQPITLYYWANRADSEEDLLLTNPDGFQYRDPAGNVIGTAKAYRQYRGLMFVLDKRFANRWQARVSYVLAKSQGTIDNSGFDSYGASTLFESPSRILVNQDGPTTNDARHELKVLASYRIPLIDVGVNAYWRSLSGGPYFPFQRVAASLIDFPTTSGRNVLLEPGTRRLPTRHLLDLRLEKVFKLGAGRDRIAVYADIANLFNKNTVTSVIRRVPDQSISFVGEDGNLESVALPFEAPSEILNARQVTIGARWSF